MAETRVKKNPDYTNSAVNLCNPPQVKALLDKLHKAQAELSYQKSTIPFAIRSAIEGAEKTINDTTAAIKGAIEQFGSYQDVEAGIYGVYNRRATKVYDALNFKTKYPDFAPAVIVESVNVDALKGLIKGGLVSEEDLKTRGVITESEAFAFYIR